MLFLFTSDNSLSACHGINCQLVRFFFLVFYRDLIHMMKFKACSLSLEDDLVHSRTCSEADMLPLQLPQFLHQTKIGLANFAASSSIPENLGGIYYYHV
jgi:hypothetical protein